jgi:branched-chain amino acid transport system permease protein
LFAVLVGLAAGFPQIYSDPLTTQIAFYTLIYAIMATAWNILAGYTGYFSLGHAAFFGIGAYSFGLICQHWSIPGGYGPFLVLPLAGLVAAAMAVPLGVITLRTRRHTFVVLTIAMLFVGQLLAVNLSDITNGTSGLGYPIPPWTGGAYNFPFYYVALTVLVLTFLTSWWIRSSKFGLGLLAIRDDEDRALGLGVRAGPSKLVAFVLAAFFIAMAGSLYAYFQEVIYPAVAFNPLDDLAMALMAFAGGLGTLYGPMLGAFIIEPAHEEFALNYGASELYLVFYGGLFLAIMLLMPRGILPTIVMRWVQVRQWRRRASRGTASEETGATEAASR